jgi:hypothetical protein
MFRWVQHGVRWRARRVWRYLSDRHVWCERGLQRGGVRLSGWVLILRRCLHKHFL